MPTSRCSILVLAIILVLAAGYLITLYNRLLPS